MRHRQKQIPTIVLTVGAILAATGCEDAIGTSGSAAMSLSFAIPTASAALSRSVASSSTTAAAEELVLEQVQLNLSEVVLEHAEGGFGGDSDGDSESDSDSDGASNERFRSGSVTVDLPLSGGVITPLTTDLPAGLYEELEMDVSTIRIRGTFGGTPFDHTLEVEEEFEMTFEPPLEVTETSDPFNVTVTIDTSTWFTTDDGTAIDPAQLPFNSELREQVVDNIEDSFKAFEDSDGDADDADSDSDHDSDDR